MIVPFSLKFLSCLFFSFGNILTKESAINGGQLCFLQSLLSAFFLFPFASLHVWPKSQFWMWAGRFFLGSLSSLFWVYSLQSQSLFNVISLQFIVPCITVLVSVFLLREKMSWGRFWAIAFSILGALLVVFGRGTYGGRGGNVWSSVSFLPIVASLLCAGVNVLGKKIMKKSNVVSITFQQMLFNCVFFFPSYFFTSQGDSWHPVSMKDFGILFALSLCASMAHLCLHFSILYADLISLIPLGGMKHLFTILWGILFCGEVPGTISFCGIIIIIISMGIVSCTLKKQA
jgi:S-adenosylmethionine uptake transporter